ncbi:phage tail protein [Fredinandcohnia humi]
MREKLEALVGAKITEFRRKMAEVKKTVRSIPNEVWVNVRVNYNKAQQRLDSIANAIRTLQTVGGNMVFGSMLAISPSIVPILAAAIGALGALGPMMGVVAGSTFALATAFGVAGVAALAFGGIAIPTISKLFDENAKLNAQQQAARAEMEKVKTTWNGIAKELEKPVLEAFSEAMRITNKVLQMARPLFDRAAVAVNNLLDSLNQSLDSTPIKAFFDYMNKSGGPMLETLGKSFGNFIKGFLSMMTAFGPLADSTAQGFLNMSQNFAKWADGLSKSDKFQAFVKYVQENMPKIRGIFRDVTAGIVYMFSAFGPLSADMMTGLQNLTTRFKEWALTLSENPQFQQFIAYIRDNGPQVLALISNLTQFLINLGVALAPIGSKILELVNGFIEWTNRMMETHPWVGKMIGVFIILAGTFQALYPLITVAVTMFSGFGGLLVKLFPSLGTVFSAFKLNLIVGLKMVGKQALKQGARIALGFVTAMGPVGWVIATVVALVALIIANWDKIEVWTRVVWTAILTWVKDTWNKAKSWTIDILAKMIAAVISKFTSIVNSVRDKMSELRGRIEENWQKAQDFLEGIDLGEIGKNIIKGLINGVTSMASSLIDSVKGVVNGAIEGAKKLLGIHSPSRVFMQIGEFTGQGLVNGLKNMLNPVEKMSAKMAQVAVIEPVRAEMSYGANGGFQIPKSSTLSSSGRSDTITRNEYGDINITVSAKDFEEINSLVDFFDRLPQLMKSY